MWLIVLPLLLKGNSTELYAPDFMRLMFNYKQSLDGVRFSNKNELCDRCFSGFMI